MTPTITAFEQSPDRGKGLARDMRVRWALEEVNQQYDVRLVSFSEIKEPAHRALHPFGQIPTYEEGDLALFESGAEAARTRACRAPHEGRFREPIRRADVPKAASRPLARRSSNERPIHSAR